MRATHTAKYNWGTLAIRADFAQASSQIRYATDDDIPANKYAATTIQVGDAQHSPAKALALVSAWLKNQAG